MLIREANINDYEAIYAVVAAAFETEAEAKLVEKLHLAGEAVVSMVAELSGKIVGYVLFSNVTLSRHANLKIIGLAPVAVLPPCQRKGIGRALIEAGLKACTVKGYEAVVVLGHPAYYPKFGFRASTEFGFNCEYDVPDDAFMALELRQNALAGVSGVICYHPAFNTV